MMRGFPVNLHKNIFFVGKFAVAAFERIGFAGGCKPRSHELSMNDLYLEFAEMESQGMLNSADRFNSRK